jgi:isochorismate hydrolase
MTSTSVRGSIPAYDLPAERDFQTNIAPWTPDPARGLLLVHDMQRYFLDFFESPVMREQLISRVAALVTSARRYGIPIAYTAQPGSMTPSERGLIADFWGSGMRATEEDRSVVPECAPAADDIVVTKWRYSAFHGNDLAVRVAATRRDQIIVCGVFASIGCLMSACDAFSRDLEAFYVGDAMADFTREDHVRGIDYAARRCAVAIGHQAVIANWDRELAANGVDTR